MTSPAEQAQSAVELAAAGKFDEAWQQMQPLRSGVKEHRELAWAWLVLLINDPRQPPEDGAIDDIIAAWPQEAPLILLASRALCQRADGRPADEPIADDDPARRAVRALAPSLNQIMPDAGIDPRLKVAMLRAFGSALRLAGRPFAAEAEKRLVANVQAEPNDPSLHFDLGLFFKAHGRWEDGFAAFQRARDLGAAIQPVHWNLAICATGADMGATACEAWRAIGLEIDRGPDGLPHVDGMPDVKVRISNAPLGVPIDPEAPRQFEVVHARRSSPCHGVILDPPIGAMAAGYGDTVLWDGAPLEGEPKPGVVPTFPMLVKLASGTSQVFEALTQIPDASAIRTLNADLPDAVWFHARPTSAKAADGGISLEAALIVEPESDPKEAAQLLSALLAKRSDVRVAVPALFAAANQSAEAKVHEQRLAELRKLRG